MPPYRNYIYEYHAKITSGEIIAGKWIKKIYEIIINGLQKQEYFFNVKAANKAIRFIENFCHHSKGRNDLIKLELWQKAIVSVIFGIQDAEKIRIFREIFIVIGRKNGKSLFASAIIAYMAYLEPEYGQEIYCLAPKLDQAALVYDGFYQMVQAEDELAELAKKRRSDIYIAESNTVIKPITRGSKYHYFKVYEPKERQIMALPFYDRVVQHAINNVLEPIFDKRFISQSYACRKGKGMHAASDTLKEWLYEWNKYHPDQPLYAIKADIHHYFQSIDHAVLKTEIRKVIKDAGVLALLDRIIDHNGNMPDGVGIPVGNLTSQLFANIYLDALDQFIKHELGVEAYIRYMDDFVILSPDKEQLRSWLARIEQFLREELKLEFNPKTTILAAKNGIDFVGYKHRATHRKVRKDSIKRIKRTIKKCESGKITKEQLQKSIQSWTGHAGHADSYNLRKKIETLAEAAIEKAA